MIKFNHIRINKLLKIRYLKISQKENTFLIFLHGFMSDLEGKKPKTFYNFAKKNKFGFLALEYSGHGKSSGEFIKGNITKWTKDSSFMIKKFVNRNDIILVGSSMGAWISLNQFKIFKKQIKGFLGIGSAPEFLENLMWKKFTKRMKFETIKNGIYYLKHGNYTYPISLQLIKDGRKNKVLNKKINSKIKISMVHGQNDDVVPISYSRKVLKIFKKAEKRLVIIKKGDHSLSSQKNLRILIKELKNISR